MKIQAEVKEFSYYEVTLEPSSGGFGEYDQNNFDLGEGWADKYDLLVEIENNVGPTFELGKDKLPVELEDIRGRIHNQSGSIYGFLDEQNTPHYFAIIEVEHVDQQDTERASVNKQAQKEAFSTITHYRVGPFGLSSWVVDDGKGEENSVQAFNHLNGGVTALKLHLIKAYGFDEAQAREAILLSVFQDSQVWPLEKIRKLSSLQVKEKPGLKINADGTDPTDPTTWNVGGVPTPDEKVTNKYPELMSLSEELSQKIIAEINKRAPKIESKMPYKAQWVLEELIKLLQASV